LSQIRQANPLPADEFALQADGKYHWVKHPNWGFLQPRQPHFAGKVYALISGVCFSACAELASTLHFHQKATFIGEEVGGDYYGNTSGFLYQVFLPHTKIALDIPVVAYYLSVHGYPAADQGVMPDYPVQSTAQDWLAGNDSGMTLALKLARGQHP
jgi:C-terminal processing protease CtpA/Prc